MKDLSLKNSSYLRPSPGRDPNSVSGVAQLSNSEAIITVSRIHPVFIRIRWTDINSRATLHFTDTNRTNKATKPKPGWEARQAPRGLRYLA